LLDIAPLHKCKKVDSNPTQYIKTPFSYVLGEKVHFLKARTGELTVLDHPAQRRRVFPPINTVLYILFLS